MRRATIDDFREVDNFIDLLAPAYEAEDVSGMKRGRKAWARILLTYGRAGYICKCKKVKKR